MHPYSTTSEERFWVPLACAGVAIGLAWVLVWIAGRTHLPFWVEVPGTATLYGILLGFFRTSMWKWKMFQGPSIVKVPDLSGEWRGYVTSSFDRLAAQHPVSVRIQQNWTHLIVRLNAQQSDSESVVASLAVDGEVVLSYQYRNSPHQGALDTMHAHTGTAVLRLSSDGRGLSGEYYSGRDRANQGLIVLTRE